MSQVLIGRKRTGCIFSDHHEALEACLERLRVLRLITYCTRLPPHRNMVPTILTQVEQITFNVLNHLLLELVVVQIHGDLTVASSGLTDESVPRYKAYKCLHVNPGISRSTPHSVTVRIARRKPLKSRIRGTI